MHAASKALMVFIYASLYVRRRVGTILPFPSRVFPLRIKQVSSFVKQDIILFPCVNGTVEGNSDWVRLRMFVDSVCSSNQ